MNKARNVLWSDAQVRHIAPHRTATTYTIINTEDGSMIDWEDKHSERPLKMVIIIVIGIWVTTLVCLTLYYGG